jgi:hypothetical protein
MVLFKAVTGLPVAPASEEVEYDVHLFKHGVFCTDIAMGQCPTPARWTLRKILTLHQRITARCH